MHHMPLLPLQPLRLLVTGAAGQLGRLVLHHLASLGCAHEVVAASRTPQHIDRRLALPRHADFTDPASLPDALRGVHRMLLISTSLNNVGPRRIAQHRNAIDAAVSAGVQRIVYTSLLNPLYSPQGAVAEDHAQTEAMLRDSGIAHIVLRNAFYMDPLRETVAAAVRSGELVSATRSGRVAYIRRSDCALAAAHALLCRAPENASSTFDIAGPQQLGGADIAAIGSAVTGQPIAFRDMDQANRTAGLLHDGLPPPLARMIAHVEAALDTGVMAGDAADFIRLTGMQAHALRAFLQDS